MKLLIILIAMLATCAGAVHSWYSKNQYVQAAMLSEAFYLVDPVKERVSDYFIELGQLPGNNQDLQLPDSQSLVGTSVSGVAVRQGGLISVTFMGGEIPQSMAFIPSVNPSSGHLYWRCVSDTISPGVIKKLRPSCERRSATQQSQLQQAILVGDTDQSVNLLIDGAQPNAFVDGLTPLMTAVGIGDRDVSQLLLEAGANPNLNARNHDGYTPIILALKNGDAVLVSLLLKYQTSPLHADHHGQTPRDHALQADLRANSTKFSYLIDASLNPQFLSHPAESFKSYERSADTALLAQGPIYVEQSSPLERAINSNSLPLARELIEQGASVNQSTSFESSPLIEASKRGLADMVSLLIDHDVSLEATDKLGRTAYLVAVGAGHGDVAELLLAAGADSAVADKNGVDAVQMQRSRAANAARLHVALSED